MFSGCIVLHGGLVLPLYSGAADNPLVMMTSHGLKIMLDHCITPVLYHKTLPKTT